MFLKSILFLKTEIFKNHFCPVLATQSRVSQVASLSCVFAGHFWRLVREWKVQSQGLLRDFGGSVRDSLVGRPSNREKHLENFFKLLSLSVSAAWPGDLLATHLSRENRVFCNMSSFSTFFSKRGSHLLVLHSVFVHFLVLLSLIHHHCGNLQILSPTCYHSNYLQGKVWVLFSTLCFAFFSCLCVLLGIHISLTYV